MENYKHVLNLDIPTLKNKTKQQQQNNPKTNQYLNIFLIHIFQIYQKETNKTYMYLSDYSQLSIIYFKIHVMAEMSPDHQYCCFSNIVVSSLID